MSKTDRKAEIRSKIMQSVKQKDTGAEMIVRKALRELGYRYRLHVRILQWTPDIVFKNRKKLIFVNGCFWHGHSCKKGNLPKTNVEFWKTKLEKNITRDLRAIEDLKRSSWEILVIWQCETIDLSNLKTKLEEFLESFTHAK